MYIEPGVFGMVSATFRHTCGHDSNPMAYGNQQYAQYDQPRQESKICEFCHNSQEVARAAAQEKERQLA